MLKNLTAPQAGLAFANKSIATKPPPSEEPVTTMDPSGCIWYGKANWNQGKPMGYASFASIQSMKDEAQGYLVDLPGFSRDFGTVLVFSNRKWAAAFCAPYYHLEFCHALEKETGVKIQVNNGILKFPYGLIAETSLYASANVKYAIIYPVVLPNPNAMFTSKLFA